MPIRNIGSVPLFLSCAVLGFVAGFLSGLFGIGGGLVMIPAMVLLLGIPQRRAHATTIAVVILSASAAVVPLALGGKVHWEAVGLLLVGASAGAYLGARLLSSISAAWLARAFIALMVIAAVRMSWQSAQAAGESSAVSIGPLTSLALVATGLVAGTLASMALGGGILFVVSLAILFSFPQHEAQATALAVTVPTTLVAALVYTRADLIEWRMAGMLSLGGVLGGLSGGRVALGVNEVLLRRMFAGLLILAAIRMLWASRRFPEPEPDTAERRAIPP